LSGRGTLFGWHSTIVRTALLVRLSTVADGAAAWSGLTRAGTTFLILHRAAAAAVSLARRLFFLEGFPAFWSLCGASGRAHVRVRVRVRAALRWGGRGRGLWRARGVVGLDALSVGIAAPEDLPKLRFAVPEVVALDGDVLLHRP
jgi:hypothetical protein